MSATRTLVLGVVRMYGSAHGYQVRRELLSWGADAWAHVQPGSIYHALRQLAKQRLLEAVSTEEGEAGPDRTVYRLTEDGEAEFRTLVTNGLSRATRQPEELSAAWAFATTLPRAQVSTLLRLRANEYEAHVANAELALASDPYGKPGHVQEMYRLWRGMSQASLDWARETVARLDAGEYVFADESADHFGAPS